MIWNLARKGPLLSIFVVFGAASVAWACTSQPRIFGLSSPDGPPGVDVKVTGQTVAPQGAVEVRWDGVEGPVLARTTADFNGSFSAVAQIPDASPGVYTVVAVADGAGVARSAFEVTAQPAVPGGAAPAVPDAGDFQRRALPDPDSFPPRPASGPLFMVGLGLLAGGMGGLSLVTVALLHRRRAETLRAR